MRWVLAGAFLAGSILAVAWAFLRVNVERDETTAERSETRVIYPLDGTLFPPDIASPTFRWQDESKQVDVWRVTATDAAGRVCAGAKVDRPEWTPSPEAWRAITRASMERNMTFTVRGAAAAAPEDMLSSGAITIRTSRDPVGAPIFYREVNLPFFDAVKDPTRIRWRFGSVSCQTPPPVVLENLPVCGNCHSFSADGRILGMDVDYSNNKGSYAVLSVDKHITIDDEKIIAWGDHNPDEPEPTFGLLSRVSPDGRYVVSTVRDQSVFISQPDLAYSQLFFPVTGILAVYDTQTRKFHTLPGANDTGFVQSNPVWSPDGKYIVFARNRAYRIKRTSGGILLNREDCAVFLEGGKLFKYDLYRIPFNDGNGGQAKPIPGASSNGMSNYFPKFSPDGKWIVFCQARSFMLLQPDSQLYIIPAAGGEPRRLQCNTSSMNSWHSWSPNGRWLVFSSKLNGPYTQLMLTHIDSAGRSTPPVVLERFSSPDRAANIPEFVPLPPGAIAKITENFLDVQAFINAAGGLLMIGDFAGAERYCRRALRADPSSALAHNAMGNVLLEKGDLSRAEEYLTKALQLDSRLAVAYLNLGRLHQQRGLAQRAMEELNKAIKIDPDMAVARFALGDLLAARSEHAQAVLQYRRGLRVKPNSPAVRSNLGWILIQDLSKAEEGVAECRKAVAQAPKFGMARANLAIGLKQLHQYGQAILHCNKALELLRAREHQVFFRRLLTQCQDAQAAAEKHIARSRQAVAAKPKDPAARVALAEGLADAGQFAKALTELEAAQALQPGRRETIQALAWLLATCPLSSVRDGNRALQLAHKASRMPGGQTARALDVLAAAQAETGDFKAALATARQALQKAKNDPSLKLDIYQRCSHYETRKPWRD